uniref:Riboflavin biosynthesis protein RibD n=1 Tax=Pseudomonas fluorescens TaxID=294 RepID=A0A5E6XKV5_PSEFL|nr:Riboflavin biosynthesis protein RibD [Pseudomonas fluorescens]
MLTSAESVLADNARMTVRGDELGLDPETTALALARPPLRVLIDGRLRVPLDAPFFTAGPALVVTAAAADPRYAQAGHELLSLPGRDGRVDLPALMLELAARGASEVLVEAGAGLVGAFARQGLIDEYQIFVAGRILGSSARPLLDWPLDTMSQAPHLQITEMRAVGDDWRVTAVPKPAPGV